MFASPAAFIRAPTEGRASRSTRVPIRYASTTTVSSSTQANARPAPTPVVSSTCDTVKNVTNGSRP